MNISINETTTGIYFTGRKHGKALAIAYGVEYLEDSSCLRNGKCYSRVKVFNLSTIQVDPYHRGLGLGDRLIKHIIRFLRFKGVKRVYLDDMSDRYRQEHNIYVNNGFRYVEDCGPEMFLEV